MQYHRAKVSTGLLYEVIVDSDIADHYLDLIPSCHVDKVGVRKC